MMRGMLLFVVACTPSRGRLQLNAECTKTDDCASGLTCVQQRCLGNSPPRITALRGDGSTRSRIRAGFVIEGENLADVDRVSFARAGQVLGDAAIGQADAAQLTVSLPSAVATAIVGQVTLEVSNPSGVTRQEMQVLQGEKGDKGDKGETGATGPFVDAHTRAEADARFTRLTACYWKVAYDSGAHTATLAANCDPGDFVIAGGCDVHTGEVPITESFPRPSSDDYKTQLSPWPIGTPTDHATIPHIDQWSCRTTTGNYFDSAYAMCCPGR